MTKIESLFDLSGKVAMVTGCRTGIGRSIAQILADAGANIIGVGSSNFDEVSDYVESIGRQFQGVQADLTNTDCVESLCDEAVKAFGRIDILVNNAGIILRDDAINYSEEYWDDVMNINLKSLFFLSQKVIKVFLEQKTRGKIVNIASLCSFQGGIRVPAYTASKFGVAGVTMALSNEFAKCDININAIAPGYIKTDNTKALQEDEARYNAILDRIPAGRWGESDDIAGAALFLCSRAADYVSGHILTVDGGWMGR